jgi:DNA-binding XRE family transcriptional regulator
MAKNGLGIPSRPSNVRTERKLRSPPSASLPEDGSHEGSGAKHRRTPDPEILAKEEKIREEFQAVFGQHLKAARLKAGLKQSDVAARTGLTQQYLSLIEAGQQNITLKTMILLAEVVDRDIRDMLRKVLETPRKK